MKFSLYIVTLTDPRRLISEGFSLVDNLQGGLHGVSPESGHQNLWLGFR